MHAIERRPVDKDARPAGRIPRAIRILKPILKERRGTSNMEWLDIIKYVIPIAAAIIAAFFPSLYSKAKTVRKATEAIAAAAAERDSALADARLAMAELDLTEKMHAEVTAAETAYDAFDKVAKQNGTSGGAMKREHVLAKLQAYALTKGYAFDTEKWGAALDAFVALTKIVNAVKN